MTAFQGIVGREPVPVDGKIRELVGRFVRTPRLSFRGLVLESASRSEVVAVFLAVLELSRAHKIMIEEDEDEGFSLRLATQEEQAMAAPEAREDDDAGAE